MFEMTITPLNARDDWCVYQIYSEDGSETLFTWFCRFVQIFELRELFANVDFEIEGTYRLSVLSLHIDRNEAYAAFSNLLFKEGMPHLNRTVMLNRRTWVKCNETGEIFKSAYECAKMHMIPESQLSKHLRNVTSHRSVRGRTYTKIRVSDIQPVLPRKPIVEDLPPPPPPVPEKAQ